MTGVSSALDITAVEEYLRSLQDRICQALAEIDGGSGFRTDITEHKGGGGGRARVLEGGKVFEKGGVNFLR